MQWVWGSNLSKRLAVAVLERGFVHGPVRRLPQSIGADLMFPVPLWLRSKLKQSVILHTRHPLEALVSHYYCVTSESVCPKRRRPGAGNQSRMVTVHAHPRGGL